MDRRAKHLYDKAIELIEYKQYDRGLAMLDTVIRDNQGNILGYPPGNDIDLSAAPPGLCLIYGVSFTGDLIQDGGTIDTVQSTNGDADISRNAVRARRVETCN